MGGLKLIYMKVGSLVVVKPFAHLVPDWVKSYVKWLPKDDESTIYTIRGIDTDGDIGILFEEGIIGHVTGREISIFQNYVKEVQPPISSEEIAELVEDACCVEVTPQKQGVF